MNSLVYLVSSFTPVPSVLVCSKLDYIWPYPPPWCALQAAIRATVCSGQPTQGNPPLTAFLPAWLPSDLAMPPCAPPRCPACCSLEGHSDQFSDSEEEGIDDDEDEDEEEWMLGGDAGAY